MAGEIEGEDMELFERFKRRPSATLEGRRERETRTISRTDRMVSKGSIKSAQLNLKVTPEFYARVDALTRNGRFSSRPDFIEHAVELHELASAVARVQGVTLQALLERLAKEASASVPGARLLERVG